MYSLVKTLLQPYTLLMLVASAALVNLWFRRRETRRRLLLLTAPFALLLMLSIPAVSHLAFGSLEWSFVPLERLPRDSQAMVVLSGGLIPANRYQPQPILAEDSLMRCLHAAELYRASGPRPVVLSGGIVRKQDGPASLAELMKTFLIEQGVAPGDLIVEDRSTTTYENAVECRKLLEVRGITRIVLVTEAAHMRRAVGCFCKQGFDVTPAPCHYRAGRYEHELQTYLPSPGAARGIQAVAHEWLGLAWYWWQNRI
ncbi:MAG TPA: YdcF family protein [Pirellulales bacterium]|nr:YdcF family protein [Pirellulales bacterium]